MTPFLYDRATDRNAALTLGSRPGANFLRGGTNLVDLMRETIARLTLPSRSRTS
jgi:xanthine dehydrogenase YagS FAD-binding subunit